jgi:hypothetical protein
LDYHRVYAVSLIFIGVMAIILINEIILVEIGLVSLEETPEGKNLLDPYRYRNYSFIFGPVVEYLRENNITIVEDFLGIFIPNFLTEIPFGEYAGEKKYWPLLWAIVPAIILITIVSFLISIYWEKDHIKEDLIKVRKYFTRIFNPRKTFTDDK